jgi:hypothetical protein
MKTFVHILIAMAILAFGSVAVLADDEITGSIIKVNGKNITVQTTNGPYDFDLTNYKGRQPKLGDRVTIWMHRHAITKMEIKADGAAIAADRALPTQASIVIVPSEFDQFVTPTGNVRVTFSDTHTEVWTQSGDCRDAHVSPKGDVGWVRAERTKVDRENMRVSGRDFLDLRLLDGTARELSPLADVPDARFIEEWRFTNRGATVVIRAHGYHGPALYLKYAVPSGKLVDHVGTYRPFAELPAWAKSIADESSKE